MTFIYYSMQHKKCTPGPMFDLVPRCGVSRCPPLLYGAISPNNFDGLVMSSSAFSVAPMMHQAGIIKIAQFNGAIEFFLRTDPCSYGIRRGCF